MCGRDDRQRSRLILQLRRIRRLLLRLLLLGLGSLRQGFGSFLLLLRGLLLFLEDRVGLVQGLLYFIHFILSRSVALLDALLERLELLRQFLDLRRGRTVDTRS